jgi:hypothetical protein
MWCIHLYLRLIKWVSTASIHRYINVNIDNIIILFANKKKKSLVFIIIIIR